MGRFSRWMCKQYYKGIKSHEDHMVHCKDMFNTLYAGLSPEDKVKVGIELGYIDEDNLEVI